MFEVEVLVSNVTQYKINKIYANIFDPTYDLHLRNMMFVFYGGVWRIQNIHRKLIKQLCGESFVKYPYRRFSNLQWVFLQAALISKTTVLNISHLEVLLNCIICI